MKIKKIRKKKQFYQVAGEYFLFENKYLTFSDDSLRKIYVQACSLAVHYSQMSALSLEKDEKKSRRIRRTLQKRNQMRMIKELFATES